MSEDFDDDDDDGLFDDPGLLEAVAQAERSHLAASQATNARAQVKARPHPAATSAGLSGQIATTHRPANASTAQLPLAARAFAPKRPVYRDERPPGGSQSAAAAVPTRVQPEGASNQRQPPRASAAPSTSDLSRLEAELTAARARYEEEARKRIAKDGEVSWLRGNTSRLEQAHAQELLAQKKRAEELQAKVAQLERAAHEDRDRHRSELIFARQEHESSIRHRTATSSQYAPPSTAQRRPRSGLKGNGKSETARAPQQGGPPPPQKRGFQNSFFDDSSPVTRRSSTAALSSPPKGKEKEKGKQRARNEVTQLSEDDAGQGTSTDPEESGAEAGDLHVEPHDPPAPNSARETYVEALFAHHAVPPSDPVETIHAIVYLASFSSSPTVRPGQPTEPTADFKAAHQSLCHKLFSCLGHPIDSKTALDVASQDRIFLSRLLSSIVDFAMLFSRARKTQELVLCLYLLRDLLFGFREHLSHKDLILTEQNKAFESIFRCVATVTAAEQQRLVEATQQVPTASKNSRRGLLARATEGGDNKRNDRIRVERQSEPVYLAVLDLLDALAWQPDEICLTNFDELLRKEGFLSTLLDASRSPRIIKHALDLLTGLSTQPRLFRVILACQFPKGASSNTASSAPNPLGATEAIAAFLLYRSGSATENHRIQRAALAVLSNLAVAHPDGVPLLGRSCALVQRLIVRIAQEAAVLFEFDCELALEGDDEDGVTINDRLSCIHESLHLLHYLVLSKRSEKSLSTHLNEKPLSRDYYLSGIGRLACSEPPEWLEDNEEALQSLEEAGGVAHELLTDVLSPDEIEELYAMCRDEEEEDDDDEGRDEEARRRDPFGGSQNGMLLTSEANDEQLADANAADEEELALRAA